jgi:iron-sulfur cluster repair protein YtfE (RIC family)
MSLLSRKSRTEGASDPAKLLITEHEKVERIFAALHSASGAVERQGLVAQLDAELSAHTAREEQILYPFIAGHVAKGGPMIDHANHEHGLARQALGDLVAIDPGDEAFVAVLEQLEKLVKAHVKEEEKAIFPALAKAVSGEDLAALRGELESAKFTAAEPSRRPG